MEELDITKLEHIPVPDDLEARLSEKIDEWAEAEVSSLAKSSKKSRISIISKVSKVAAAASIALLVGIGLAVFNNEEKDNTPISRVDTYHDPQLAYEEAERALNLLAANINRCQREMEKVESVSQRSQKIINKSLKSIIE